MVSHASDEGHGLSGLALRGYCAPQVPRLPGQFHYLGTLPMGVIRGPHPRAHSRELALFRPRVRILKIGGRPPRFFTIRQWRWFVLIFPESTSLLVDPGLDEFRELA
jgi:hypothetical protein